MQDIFPDLQNWLREDEPFVLATVTQTWGSAPRGVGASMAVTGDMKVLGSVSGGCIENAVIEEAQQILKTGRPKHLSFGVSDETAWSVGLTCGGKVRVFAEKHIAYSSNPTEQQIWQALKNSLAENHPAILVTRLRADKFSHLLIFPDGSQVGDWADLNETAGREALQAYRRRRSGEISIDGEPLFVQVFPRKDRLLVIGAAHISIPLVKFARELDFEVIVIDPRKVFASPERFPVPPDQLVSEWPDEVLSGMELNEDCYAAILTHDPKIDDVALAHLLKSEVTYIGALGSQRTHARRMERLREAGFSEADIARIEGPAGLPIDAKTPTEIALSIMAQIVQTRRSRVPVA